MPNLYLPVSDNYVFVFSINKNYICLKNNLIHERAVSS